MVYEYEKVVTPSSGLRLHLNENTAGCSPKVMAALSTIGIAAMIWVGGGIIVHGLEVFGFGGIAHALHDAGAAAAHALPALGGLLEWTIGALGSGLLGLVIVVAILGLLTLFGRRRQAKAQAAARAGSSP